MHQHLCNVDVQTDKNRTFSNLYITCAQLHFIVPYVHMCHPDSLCLVMSISSIRLRLKHGDQHQLGPISFFWWAVGIAGLQRFDQFRTI